MPKCELCDPERVTQWWHQGKTFLVIECKTCHIPMLVLREHGPLSEAMLAELQRARRFCKVIFGSDIEFRTPRSIKDHYHEHVIPKQEGSRP